MFTKTKLKDFFIEPTSNRKIPATTFSEPLRKLFPHAAETFSEPLRNFFPHVTENFIHRHITTRYHGRRRRVSRRNSLPYNYPPKQEKHSNTASFYVNPC